MSHETQRSNDGMKASWRQFLDVYEPLRADLYRYCRHLTRSPWDAEDMSQDAMARAYVTLACMTEPPANPRAWLFRVASNAWLNRVRQAREVLGDGAPHPEPATEAGQREAREAAGTLIAQLSPQERAAVVLKDVFDSSLEEISEALGTSVAAVKAALHRGRSKLVEPTLRAPSPVAPVVLDAFCDAFNAADLERLTALLLHTATMEFPGVMIEYGAEALRAGSLRSTILGCPEGRYRPAQPPRCEVRMHRGEALFLWWVGKEVDAVVHVELEGDRIARLRNYRHSPELTREVCRELEVPFLTHGYGPKLENEQ